MAKISANLKLHGFSKRERLCNFSLKDLLFDRGNTFHSYPFKVYWKLIDINLEKVFFKNSLEYFDAPQSNLPQWKKLQNPSYPFKKIPENAFFTHPAQCLVGVPAKIHKKAVVRNHLKRLTREAYRKNKISMYTFVQQIDCFLLVAFIYTARPILSSKEIEQKIIVSLQRIQENFLIQQND